MMKFSAIALLICVFLVLEGCSQSQQPTNAATEHPPIKHVANTNSSPSLNKSDQTKPSESITTGQSYPAPKVARDSILLSSKTNGRHGWFIYSQKGDPYGEINTYYSSNKGSTWISSSLPLKDAVQAQLLSYDKESIAASLHMKKEHLSSWILLSSDVASGNTQKYLYRSDNSGRTWKLIEHLNDSVRGYVTGITFINNNSGWLGLQNTGGAKIPLYHTKDGGKKWAVQSIPMQQGYKYGDVYPPVFVSSKEGTLRIKFVNDDKRNIFEYKTTDGGQTWKINK